jgi:hypothetical protein
MKLLRETIYQADDGKVFKNKSTGAVGGELILIGCADSIENYEEIDKPTYEEIDKPTEVTE